MPEQTDNERDRIANPIPTSAEAAADVRPMTAGQLGRLFVVPALIVALLLAVALVVVLFGSLSLEKQQTVADLVAVLERDDGQRTLSHMLLPRDKEYWQAAQELARRLENRDKHLAPNEIEPTAARLAAVLDRFAPGQDVADSGASRHHFLMLALARLKTPAAVPPLVRLLRDPNAQTRRAALQGLAEMHEVPEARRAVAEVLPLLADPAAEVRMVACAAVSVLAERGDPVVVRAVAEGLSGDRETQWNAAMTLARLGSPRGKDRLMNMLDRGFWENLDLDYDEGGTRVRRRFSPLEVSNNLTAAIEASAELDDPELDAMIDALSADSSHAVQAAARTAKAGRGSTTRRSSSRAGAPHDVDTAARAG